MHELFCNFSLNSRLQIGIIYAMQLRHNDNHDFFSASYFSNFEGWSPHL